MNLPAELIELIALSLANYQQYKCLTLSRGWFESVHRAMYKTVYIKNRHQFKLFLQVIKIKGHLVRQLYLSTNKKIVGITSLELDQLAIYCPYIEILDFDQSLWKYSRLPSTVGKWNCIRQLPTFSIYTMPALTAMSSYKLRQLSLHGELVSALFDQQQSSLIRLLVNIPHLQRLYLNSKQNKSHVIQISLQDMESIHTAAPLLTDLELSGSFRLTMDYTSQLDTLEAMQHIPQTNVRNLRLKATIIPPQWIYYIARKYPRLQQLDIEALQPTYTNTAYSTIIPSAKEIQALFCMLLDCCPRLRKIHTDSVTGKMYMTGAFFDRLATHVYLKEIKMKSSTYNLVPRGQFFDLLATRGQHVITGLGTEVVGTDVHISNILNPLSRFTKLTELILCCGHPYFDCDIAIVLSGCQQLLDLTVKSAHLMLHKPQKHHHYPQHSLKSLHLSTVSFSVHAFDYISKTCHALKQLSFYECDQRDDSTNQIRLNMPHNEFDLISINGIRLDSSVPLECRTSPWIPNARILSIETTADSKRWYHAYNNGSSNNYYHEKPKIQRLNKRKSTIAEQYYQYDGWINNNQKAIHSKMRQPQTYLSTRTSREWEHDLSFGCISIQCKSIKKWDLVCNITYCEF